MSVPSTPSKTGVPTTAQPPVRLTVRNRRDRLSDVFLVVLFLGCLWLPIATSLLNLQFATLSKENRTLAQLPTWPQTTAEFLALPDRLSALAGDRFGLRDALLWLDGKLRYHLFKEAASDQILFGRHRRVFLSSHLKGYPFSAIDDICGLQTSPDQIGQLAADVASLLDDVGRLVPRSLYVSIPTAPALYPEDLPRWLATLCRNAPSAVARIKVALDSKRSDLANRLVYPIETMQALEPIGPSIPRANFHWQDLGAKAVAEVVAERWLGLPKLHDVPLRMVTERSDLSQFIPGLDLSSVVGEPDYAQSGVIPCYGLPCVPELTPFAHAVAEITRFHWREGSGPKLLLISDSFGLRASRYFSEYFAMVIHVNPRLDLLTPERGRLLRLRLFELLKPDTVILLFHDGSVGSAKVADTELFGK